MNIIVKRAILYYSDLYPMSKIALLTWYHEFSKQKFHTYHDLKELYGNASIISNNRVIFNIKGNEYRLIVSINYKKSAAYIIWFGTHRAYDKIDANSITFDPKILTYKSK